MADSSLDLLDNLSPIPNTALVYLVSAAADWNGTVADLFVSRALSAITALGIRSTGAAFDLQIASSEVLTANRVLSIVLGNTARTLTVGASASVSGSNTGDQDLSGLLVRASNLSDLTNAGTARTNLGLVIGTNVQAFSTRLSEVVAIGSALQQIRVNAGGTALEYFTPSAGGDALVANPLSQFAATTSAQLRSVLSDENGTGAALFDGATSPTFVTPALGTPSALTLANATGLPPTTGISGWPANAAGTLTNNGSGTLSWVAGGGSGATTALDNLASVAINTALILGTSDAAALGSATKMWSDLFLASGAVINFNNGDVTLTHATNALTLNGGQMIVDDGSVGAPGYTFSADPAAGLYRGGGNDVSINTGTGGTRFAFQPGLFYILSDAGQINFGSGVDIGLRRISGGLEINDTNAGTLRDLSLRNLITTATSSTGTAVIIDGSNVLRPQTSSLRFKTNVRAWHASDDAMNAFLSLSPIAFDYRTNGAKDVIGFAAEHLAAVNIELVNLDQDGQPYSTREHAILAFMHEILQRQQAEIAELKRRTQ